jgi:hypothetical protein
VLAGQLDLGYQNWSIEGDNAVGVGAQICAALGGFGDASGCSSASMPSPQPHLITITVGADDIHFDQCTWEIFTEGLQATNPCAPATLGGAKSGGSLGALNVNLTADLKLIATYYPKVPVVVTGYYNPLGTAELLPSNCPLVTAAVVGPFVESNDTTDLANYILEYVDREAANLPPPAVNMYTDAIMSSFARQVMKKLNDTLKLTATAVNPATGMPYASFVPLSLSNGLCSATPQVFEPLVTGSFSVPGPFPPVTISFGQSNVCPGPKDPEEITIPPTSASIAGVITYSYSFTTNCIPHPTIAGQQVLAQEIARALPSG